MRAIGKRLAVVLAVFLTLALVVTVSLSWWVVRRPLPTTDGESEIAGLTGQVRILRDDQGVAQIYAETDSDLFFAQGYVHAQDRFFEMDYRRHVASGRVSELVGDVDAARQADAVIRTLGWREVAEAELEAVSSETLSFLQAYADGVNAYLDTREASELAVEYTVLGLSVKVAEIEPWTVVDSLVWLKAMAWDLRTNYDDELYRAAALRATGDVDRVEELFPDYPYETNAPIVTGESSSSDDEDAAATNAALLDEVSPQLEAVQAALDAVPTLLGEGAYVGSNSFVISGQYTQSGLPILANDPHLTSGAPGVWYQVGLHCTAQTEDCTFDVSGFSFAGMPGVIIGRNAQLSWGLTNMGADVTDFFLERINSDGTYRYGAENRELEECTEVIEVAGGESFSIRVRSTVHGPILSDVLTSVDAATGRAIPAGSPGGGSDGYAVALAWTALTPGRTADAIFAMDRAQTAEDAAAAAALFDVPAQNIVFATASGDIGYQAPGKIPILSESITGDVAGMSDSWPRLGWDPQYDWQGYLAAEQLPSALNPSEGFIVAANQAVTQEGAGPRLAEDYDYGYRAQRLRTLIQEAQESGTLLTLDDAVQFMTDSTQPIADQVVSAVLSLDIKDAFFTSAVDELRVWKEEGYPNSADSAGAAFYNAIWANLLDLTFADELPDSLAPDGSSRWIQVVSVLLRDPDNLWWDYAPTTRVTETRDEILQQAVEQARNQLTNALGSDPSAWQWGDLHKARFEHAVFSEEVAPWPLTWLMNPTPIAVSGSGGSPLATAWDASATVNGRYDYTVTTVPSMRMAVDMSDPDAAQWVVTTGVSGHPASAHYADQVGAWASGDMFEWPFTAAAVEEAAADTLILNTAD